MARAVRQLLALLAVALIPASISGVVQLKWKKEVPLAEGEVRLATAEMWGDSVHWIDARSRAKYEREHIPGATLLNEDEWESLVPQFLNDWQPDKSIVIYCDSGSCDASHAVARRLKGELKLENAIWVLKGGWTAWEQR